MTLSVQWLVHPSDCRLVVVTNYTLYSYAHTALHYTAEGSHTLEHITDRGTRTAGTVKNKELANRSIGKWFPMEDHWPIIFYFSASTLDGWSSFRTWQKVHIHFFSGGVKRVGVEECMQMKIQWTECTNLLSVNWSRISEQKELGASLLPIH